MACQAECTEDQIDLFQARTPPLIALVERATGFPTEEYWNARGQGGVSPYEGGDVMDDRLQEVDEPPVGWLSSIWEGGSSDGEA